MQLVIEGEDGNSDAVQEIAEWQRGELRPENVGMRLAEAKNVLRQLQQAMVAEQTAAFAEAQAPCPCCGKRRASVALSLNRGFVEARSVSVT